MSVLRLSKPDRRLVADLRLEGSKSLSNRALVVLALAGADPSDWLSHLAAAADTRVLQRALQSGGDYFDVGNAGTAFRFLTAYLALQPGAQVLTGSARMRERPIGPLVEALRQLGADVTYLENEGFPPLRIGPPPQAWGRQATVRAGVSSQFLSALLLIGPYLPQGLELLTEGTLVSRPYLEMTLRLMRHFGARAGWRGERLVVEPGRYEARPLRIEADWSAASYWYALAALADEADLVLRGLGPDSWQGDAVLTELMEKFGVNTGYLDDGIRLRRLAQPAPSMFEYNFSGVPDLAQTLAVLCAARGIPALFSGLETLAIKETDRVAALRAELARVGVSMARMPARFSRKSPDQTFYMIEGQAAWEAPTRFATHGDHRMAMALATLGMLGPVEIEHPAVTAKSYPAFWEHLNQAGFNIVPVE
jgi:3-phosphoshikimate 1-carboxyvinyltransferase